MRGVGAGSRARWTKAARSVWLGDGFERVEQRLRAAALQLAGALEAVVGLGRQRTASRSRRPRAGRPGRPARGGRTFTSRTASSTDISLSPANSRSPVSISKSTVPSEKMSERASTGLPHACSGDMYWSFPLSAPICVWLGLRDRLGDAEVAELDVALEGDEHVLRRDVAMHEAELAPLEVALAVRVVEGRGEARRRSAGPGRAAAAGPAGAPALRIERRSLPSTYSMAM